MKHYSLIPVFTFLILISVNQVKPANVLFFFVVGTYSHRITVWPLVEELVERGHNVTFIQPYHPKKPNPKVHEFFPLQFQADMKGRHRVTDGDYDLLNQRLINGRAGDYKMVDILGSIALKLCEQFVNYQETQEWVKNVNFDLVIMDGLFNECGLGFAHKWGAKTMIFGTTSLFAWHYEPYGIPVESSWIPELHMSFQYPLTFWERVQSTLLVPLNHLHRLWVYFPKLEVILRNGLENPEMPALQELERGVSLILLNTHFSEELARSFPPFVVSVGGMHVEKKKKRKALPKDMTKFIKESGDAGFIFVSFGSMAQIGLAPPEVQKTFYEVFRDTKIRFIWKWEGERPAEMPDNVFTAEWMPQAEILAHPKIRAFITHGGLMSIQESILSEVPLIVFPIFAEQDYNAFRIERIGRGIRLEIQTLTKIELKNAIDEILTNQTYKENMKKTAKVFKDRPQDPLDTAVWWTEYVLRHDDLSHLKPLSMHQHWFQRRLLDVWFFVIFVIIFIVIIVPCLIFKKFMTKGKTEKTKSSNKSKKDK